MGVNPIGELFEKSALDDCFEEDVITSYTFKRSLNFEDIEFLKPYGNLKVYKKFPKPFFRIDKPEYFILQGAVGLFEIRVIFKKGARLEVKDELENQIKKMITCDACGKCISVCKKGAIKIINGKLKIDEKICDNCLECLNYFRP